MAPIFDQVKSVWQRLRMPQRLAIIGAVVVAIGIVITLIATTSSPTMHVLFSDLDPKDAAAIVEKLKEQNIPYELSDGGTAIRVPQSQVYELRLALAREGLPAGSTVGYEIFDRTNLGMSDFVQKLNHKRALEGELQKTIASFDEVQKVRVMIVLPEKHCSKKTRKSQQLRCCSISKMGEVSASSTSRASRILLPAASRDLAQPMSLS